MSINAALLAQCSLESGRKAFSDAMPRGPSQDRRKGRLPLPPSATSAPSPTAERGRVAWAGGGWQTDLANALINCKPLYNKMKVAAKNHLKKTASSRGIRWMENVAELEANLSLLEGLKDGIESDDIHFPDDYPEYYLKEFHAYEEGNLSWLAAFEVESATEVIYLNTWKEEKELSVAEARQRLRGAITTAMQEFQRRHGARPSADILDIGCSVGESTRFLAETFPTASVIGLDLSPYFLAVAELREREKKESSPLSANITYMHALMEETGLPSASQDLVSSQFVAHECTPAAIIAMVKEARRLLRPGGILLVSDNDPESKVLKNLPPVIASLMKSTEPHTDAYFSFDLEACFKDGGMLHVTTVQSDPRHRCVLGLAPT